MIDFVRKDAIKYNGFVSGLFYKGQDWGMLPKIHKVEPKEYWEELPNIFLVSGDRMTDRKYIPPLWVLEKMPINFDADNILYPPFDCDFEKGSGYMMIDAVTERRVLMSDYNTSVLRLLDIARQMENMYCFASSQPLEFFDKKFLHMLTDVAFEIPITPSIDVVSTWHIHTRSFGELYDVLRKDEIGEDEEEYVSDVFQSTRIYLIDYPMDEVKNWEILRDKRKEYMDKLLDEMK